MSKTKGKGIRGNKYRKKAIPKALREQVWVKYVGERYEHQCTIRWCKNNMTVFDFHVGHDKPECKGGKTTIDNLRPICSRCNLSMSSNFTIKEWEEQFRERDKNCIDYCCCVM